MMTIEQQVHRSDLVDMFFAEPARGYGAPSERSGVDRNYGLFSQLATSGCGCGLNNGPR